MPLAWLSTISRDDVDTVGGKGAPLGELRTAALPVPPAFVVTAKPYRTFIEDANVAAELFDTVDVDREDSAALAEAA